jgi:galactokinase
MNAEPDDTPMLNGDVDQEALKRYRQHFGSAPAVAAYAPGRVEILGNHTDYNEGYVLSAAIDCGTCFLAAPAQDSTCRLVAGDLMEEVVFDAGDAPRPSDKGWPNYVVGVLAGLRSHGETGRGFNGLFYGNVPLGAGLSSSAALEMAAGLALCALYGISLDRLDLARIGQAAEHDYAGVKCGLLDQIASLFGSPKMLVMTDFRTLAVQTVPLGPDVCFLMCNTNVKHALVDGEYNERRRRCEEATQFFASCLPHPVTALRDVTWGEWEQHSSQMDPVASNRAAHVIGENTRVLRARELLEAEQLEEFGTLMFESHESSRVRFENSCVELDFLVHSARNIPGVMGARLSGGGFGGSVVVLLHPRDVEVATHALSATYLKEFGRPCDVRTIRPSAGASLIQP